jgi:hypothetical protein
MNTTHRLLLSAVLVAACLASARAVAGGGAYRLCDISNGRVFACGAWYQGRAVLFHDGAYRACEISNGQVFTCGAWFQGRAVARHDGALRSCEIANGRIVSCGAWYQGKAVVFAEP